MPINPPAKQSNVLNIDDMPINAGRAKNFEELIESNLNNYEFDPS
jgi:hypothetical protein